MLCHDYSQLRLTISDQAGSLPATLIWAGMFTTRMPSRHLVRARSNLRMAAWVFPSTIPIRFAMILFSTLNTLSTLAILFTINSPSSIFLFVTDIPYSAGLGFDVSGTATTSPDFQLYLSFDTMIAGLAFCRRRSENGNGSMTTHRCRITSSDTGSIHYPLHCPISPSKNVQSAVLYRQSYLLSTAIRHPPC